MAPLTMVKALNDGLRAAMERDPKVLIMGEDVGRLGGVFRVTDGLQKDFGEQRVLDTPLAESGIIGTAIGLAILVSISTARTNMLVGSAEASPDALVAGFRWSFYAGIVFAIIGTLMALLIQQREFSPDELEPQAEAPASA